MLSSQNNQLSTMHRRQNSTPTTSSPMVKASYSPAHFTPQQGTHRRGLSIDMAMQFQGNDTTPKQEHGPVSTNPGPQSQQNMRAAQMLASSRPGLDEYVRNQPTGFESEWKEFQRPEGFQPSMELFGHSFSSLNRHGRDGQGNTGFLELADPFGMPEQFHGIPNPPQTPQKQRILDRYPMTPITETRHNTQMLPQTVQSSPIRRGPNGTIKPGQSAAMRRGGSCQDTVSMTRQLSDGPSVPSPPSTAPLRYSATFDATHMPNPSFLDIAEFNIDFAPSGDYSSSSYSPTTNHGSPSASSFQSSPDLAPVALFGELVEMPPHFSALAQQSHVPTSEVTTPKRKVGSPKKSSSSKNNSDNESSFNPMDYMHNDTGVTDEEINAHIQGPDESGKYICLHEECMNNPKKRKDNSYGRKENVRAHVQTHLEDRRFECDVCYKRFVRPNDLKRHWHIHLNKRDFKCVCNAAFNRHDALKRHRERSEYCESGGKRGIPGSPKKEEKKRGRPKKIAPTESDERKARKALIRRQVLQKKQASASSSVVSSQPSPPADFDMPDLPPCQPNVNGYSPVMGSFTPPASPGSTADDIFSPMHSQSYCTPKGTSISPPPTRGSMASSLGLSTKSFHDSKDFGMDFLNEPLLPTADSPPKSTASQYGTPPELDISSSSPSAQFVDFGFDPLSQSSQTSTDTDFLSDLSKEKYNDNFDNMFTLMNSGGAQETTSKLDDMELFRDSLQDDSYWANVG